MKPKMQAHSRKVDAKSRGVSDAALDSTYPQATMLELGLLAVVILIKYTQLTSRFPPLADMRFELIVNAIIFFLVFFKKKINLPINPIVGAVTFLYLCMAIKVPLSVNVPYSWDIFIDRVVKFSVLAYLIANIALSPKTLRLVIIFFLVSCAKIVQEGFWGWLTGGLMWENQGVVRLNGSVSLYGNPNSLSGFAVGLIPFIYYLSPRAKRYEKLFFAALAVGATIIVIFTASRTGYMGVIAFFAYVIARSKTKSRAFAALLVIVVAAAIFVPPSYKERFMSSFTGQDKEGGSTKARKQILIDAADIFLEHPLGIGVAAFPFIRQEKFGRSQDTHNLYMEVLTNLGIQGGMAFIVFITSLFRLLTKTQKSILGQLQKIEAPAAFKKGINSNDLSPDSATYEHISDLKFVNATIDAVKGFLIARLVLGIFGMDMYEIYWWFALGLALATYRISAFAQKKTSTMISTIEKPLSTATQDILGPTPI